MEAVSGEQDKWTGKLRLMSSSRMSFNPVHSEVGLFVSLEQLSFYEI